jgi:putative endonuclease
MNVGWARPTIGVGRSSVPATLGGRGRPPHLLKTWWHRRLAGAKSVGMKDARRTLGDRGEDLAAASLKKQGYKILARNYITPLGEIDLVARQGKTVVFVEVKTRTGHGYGSPQEAVHPAKQARLRRLAEYYLKQQRLQSAPVRFDVVGITIADEGPQVEIIQDAF